MIKTIIIVLAVSMLVGCASMGDLYKRGKYTETVCTKKLFKKQECKEVTKEGLHVVKRIVVKGTASKFSFKDGEETGEGASFMPDFSGLQLKNQ